MRIFRHEHAANAFARGIIESVSGDFTGAHERADSVLRRVNFYALDAVSLVFSYSRICERIIESVLSSLGRKITLRRSFSRGKISPLANRLSRWTMAYR